MAPIQEHESLGSLSALLDLVDLGDVRLADLLEDAAQIPLAPEVSAALEHGGQAIVDAWTERPAERQRVAERMTADLLAFLFEA